MYLTPRCQSAIKHLTTFSASRRYKTKGRLSLDSCTCVTVATRHFSQTRIQLSTKHHKTQRALLIIEVLKRLKTVNASSSGNANGCQRRPSLASCTAIGRYASANSVSSRHKDSDVTVASQSSRPTRSARAKLRWSVHNRQAFTSKSRSGLAMENLSVTCRARAISAST